MRAVVQRHMFGAAAALAILAGCSSGTTMLSKPVIPESGSRLQLGLAANSPLVLGPNIYPRVGFLHCPPNGPLKYVSDGRNSVIYVYAGKFAGQAPCGQLTSWVFEPVGLYVNPSTHDLYIASQGFDAIAVYHRGTTTPYNAYNDPSGQMHYDVTVAKDGTVISSNLISGIGGPIRGSISTWRGGPNGGTFVGNFPITSPNELGGFVTVNADGIVYFNDIDGNGKGALFTVSCPAGACGTQTQVAGVSFNFYGGMAFDATGDLIAVDLDRMGHNSMADTFELPNPSPVTFPIAGEPFGLAINKRDRHLFVADLTADIASEYSYPSGLLIGTVPPGIPGGQLAGIAIDP